MSARPKGWRGHGHITLAPDCMHTHTEHVERICSIARSDALLMNALLAARSLGLNAWCIGAGAVRNRVWDHLHHTGDGGLDADVDLVYFDTNAQPSEDHALQARLGKLLPNVSWDVTNQAHVHLWYEQSFGLAVRAVASLEEGISTWPEYATCVGLTLNASGTLDVIAPHGLEDLFALRLRHNPLRATRAAFLQRVASKRWLERWPELRICAP